MTAGDLLIFDMDGVLVDVSESYRETIRSTVTHFTGYSVAPEVIQEYKNQGGYNDDWPLTHKLIQDAGVEVDFDSVVREFQRIFRGPNGYDGLIQRERWVAEDGLLDRLRERYRLAVFTGRFHEEAEVTLQKYAPNYFDPVMGADDVKALKPDPDGLLQICAAVPHEKVFYLGDTVDDARSAAAAKVPFIGISGPRTPERAETVKILEAEGAVTVLSSIHELEALLPKL